MADSISQSDLDALWGSLSGNDSAEPAVAAKAEPAPQTGVSQADLDALWGDLGGGDGASASNGTGDGGMSQSDLDALWATAPSEAEMAPAGTTVPPPAPPGGGNLSQDDIDMLLAEMGK